MSLPYQMVAETRTPLPPKPGVPERYDYEYERRGVCNLFMFFEPKASWRHIDISKRRTAQDFAQQMRKLVNEHYPEAEKIRVVLDNLNTHTGGALYEAFEPQEARRILGKLEFHYTPKHGSWLNQVEIEFSVLSVGSASVEGAYRTKRRSKRRRERGSGIETRGGRR